MMKRLVSLCLALALVLACAAAGEAPDADGKTTLTFLDIFPDDARQVYYAGVFARYTAEKDADVVIEYEKAPWEDGYVSLVILCSSGDLPDLFSLQPDWIGEFAANGWIVPLDGYIGTSGISGAFAAAADALFERQRGEYGAVYMIPDGLTAECVYVRADWIGETLGIGYTDLLDEWTWDRYIDLVYELTDPGKGRYGISFRGGFGGVDDLTAYMRAMRGEPGVMWAGTGGIDGIDYLYDTEEDADLMNRYVSIYRDGCAPAQSVDWDTSGALKAFCGGLTGTLTGDTDMAAVIRGGGLTDDQWGALPVPAISPGGRIFTDINAGCGYGISGRTEYPDEVWRVIEFLYEGANNADFCRIMNRCPMTWTPQDPLFGENGPMAGVMLGFSSPQLWHAESMYGPADVWHIRRYSGTTELQKVLLNAVTVKDFLTWFDDAVTGITVEYLKSHPEADGDFGKAESFYSGHDVK